MSIIIPTLIEKCKGAMLATAIGDALGWPNEQRSRNTVTSSKVNDFFVEWTRRCSAPHWHYEKILAGEYSDDTQMTLSVARSLIAGNWQEILTKRELPFWLGYERGGGRAILKAANACKKGTPLWKTAYPRDYYNAGGNGAVMRILPHVIAMANESNTIALMTDVIKDTLISHGHPRAILGATCYAYALDYLLRKDSILGYGQLVSAVIEGENVWGAFPNINDFGNWLEVAKQHKDYDFAKEWDSDRAKMISQLEYIRSALKKGLMLDDNAVLTQLECFTKVNGAGDVAILTAIYLASKYANNPALGIKVPAFSIGADTDTIASITGGLLGMLCGTSWIPSQWKIVQDYDCLVQIVELLLSENRNAAAKTIISEVETQSDIWVNTLIGKIRLIEETTIQNGKYATVTIKKWKSVLGQTLYLKHFQRNEERFSRGRLVQLKILPTVADSMPTQLPAQRVHTTAEPQDEGQKQFRLNDKTIDMLLAKPEFRQNKTVGKVFKVIQAIIGSKNSTETIAKQFEVELAMVKLLEECVK